MTEHPEQAARRELVVVTGASTGIGRAAAKRMAADGYHVLAGVRRQEDGESLTTTAIEPVMLDVTDSAQIDALRRRIETDPDGLPLHAVINNAGIAVNAPVEVLDLADWRRQFEVGVFGQIAVIQALLPALICARGRIVNLGSTASKVAMPSFGAYAGAKFAMDAVSDALRREVAGLGVGVVVVTPGAVRTKLTERGLAAAERVTSDLTADQHRRYDRLMAAFRTTVASFDRDGVAPDVVAAAISRAVTARTPKTRYTVGRDARFMLAATRMLSDRVLDRMVLARMNLLTGVGFTPRGRRSAAGRRRSPRGARGSIRRAR